MPLTDEPIIRALSIRQPYAEQILLGKKKIEYRSRNSNIRERVYLYASKGEVDNPAEWRKAGAKPGTLPTGVIVGTVEIVGSAYDEDDDIYDWKLARPERLATLLKPVNQPQPGVWRPQFAERSVKPSPQPFTVPAEPFADMPPNRPRRGAAARPLGGGAITGELICYHNPETMGAEAWEIFDQPFSAISTREYAGARGKRIWVVTGRGTPRRYYLAGWFTVDTVDTHPDADVPIGTYCYAGDRGELARRMTGMVEITKLPWLPALRKACANFVTLQHVRDQSLLAALHATWDGRK